jgi:alpha-L-rhamnosidase
LSWGLESKDRAQTQSAYQILVASSAEKLRANDADLWDSGRVASNQSLQVPYAGRPLVSGQCCFWKVRSWDQDNQPSAYSSPASWEMGLLTTADWHAHWIAQTTDTNSLPAPLLRRTFALNGKVKKARAYISGLGYYELHLNGKKIGDHLLDPGYTRYDKRVLYVTYDITDALRPGTNAMGVILGNGWFNVQTKAVWNFHQAPWRAAPKLLCQLLIEYADGRTETIGTDSRWTVSTGPITFDSIYGGQTYDARLEKPGWDTADYDDNDWPMARIVDPPAGQLRAQTMPAIKADQLIKPVKLTEPKPGVFIFDLGQNFAGYTELNVPADQVMRNPQYALSPDTNAATLHGPPVTITLRYGERVTKDGALDRAEIQQHVLRVDRHQQFQSDTYLFDPDALPHVSRFTFQIPRFTYHGFQYVELTGFPGRPTLDTLRGVFIHSAVPVAGEFECSNPMLNRIWRAGRWSYLSNLQGIPTDCPHREKNGWTGDAHLAAEQGLFNFAPAAVYTKWINDLGDEQRPTGELPGIVPTSGWGYAWGNGPAWDSAFLLIPYYLYEYCGDPDVLRHHYPELKRYVDYLTSKAKDGIVAIGLNDWAPYKTQTPADITSTAYYYRDAQIVSLAAQLCGDADAARHYATLASDIRKAFNEKFYHGDTGLYGNGSQTSLSCALYQGLVPAENESLVLSNLVADIESKGNHIDTGILGAKYLLNTLTDHGRADVAYRIVSQKDLPGWGWWLEQGAATLWEDWKGGSSRNHIMYGDILAWFYKTLAGINPDPAAPGFGHIIIRPNPVGDLTFARASCDSVRGRIVSDWKIQKGQFDLKVEIPANTTATVYVPAANADQITEHGKPAAKAKGVHFLRFEQRRALYEIGSGSYSFSAPL